MASYSKLIARAKAITRRLEADKRLYAELDDIINELIRRKFKHGHGAVLIDNFKLNTTWRSTPFRRFELQFKRKEN